MSCPAVHRRLPHALGQLICSARIHFSLAHKPVSFHVGTQQYISIPPLENQEVVVEINVDDFFCQISCGTHWPSNIVAHLLRNENGWFDAGWWLSLPLWKMMEFVSWDHDMMSSSVGIMTFPTEWNHKINVPIPNQLKSSGLFAMVESCFSRVKSASHGKSFFEAHMGVQVSQAWHRIVFGIRTF